MMRRIINSLQSGIAFEWGIIAIAFCLPLYPKALSGMIILSTLLWLLKKDLLVRVKGALSQNTFILIVLYFLIHVVSYFLSDNKGVAGFDLVEKLSMIIFPLLFMGSGGFHFTKREWIEKGFVLGMICAIIICTINGVINSYHNPFTHGIYNISFWEETLDKPWWWLILSGYSYFNYVSYAYHLHPSYFALFLTFGVFLITKKQEERIPLFKSRIIRNVLATVFIINIFLLQSRAGFIGLFLYLIWTLIKSSKRTKMNIVYGLSIIGLIVVILFTGRSESLTSKLSTANWAKIKQTNIRFTIWNESISLIKEKPIFGYHIGDAKSVLVERFHKNNIEEAQDSQFNAHNQFFETTLKLGLIGFLLLLAVLIYPIYSNINNLEVYLFFLLIILIHFMFESMLERYSGVSFIAFFYCFINSIKYNYDPIFTTKDR